jgi:hypothetical protein
MRDRRATAVPVALLAFVAATALGLAGCRAGEGTTEPSPSPSTSAASAPILPSGGTASASPSAALPPASAAGGVCMRIRFEEVAALTGVRFEVAGASGTPGRSQACVLGRVGASVPDLTFTVVPVAADLTAADYAADYVPSGATTLPGLGEAGFSRVLPAASGAGPKAEIGWLRGSRTYTVSLTTERPTTPAAARAAIPKLVALARRLTA